MKKYKEWIDKQKWIFAKTYANKAPHEYIVIKQGHPERKMFEEFVLFIRKHGYKEKFWNRYYTYYNIGEYKYWTMGAPLEQTYILNRTKLKTLKM